MKRLCIVLYQDWLVPSGYGGITWGFIIAIRKRYRNDRGLLEHEKIHVGQFWRTLCLFPLLYFLSKTLRLRWEVQAYREQLRWYKDDRTETFARYLAQKYRLPISTEQAVELLRR